MNNKNIFFYASNNGEFVISSINELFAHICSRSDANKIFYETEDNKSNFDSTKNFEM
jgi:hypothetical protein